MHHPLVRDAAALSIEVSDFGLRHLCRGRYVPCGDLSGGGEQLAAPRECEPASAVDQAASSNLVQLETPYLTVIAQNN
jgi:hypothetical protein